MRWFLKLPQWIRISIGLLVVGTIFLWIWQLSAKRLINEPVWDGYGPPDWVIPVVVSGGVYEDATLTAVRQWNRATGCTLFRVLPVGEAAAPRVRVIPALGTPCGVPWPPPGHMMDKNDAAGAYLCADGTAEIHIAQAPDLRLQYVVIMHELGHVLGLAHDPHPSSVMYYDASVVAARDSFQVTSKDAAALYAHYCRPPVSSEGSR